MRFFTITISLILVSFGSFCQSQLNERGLAKVRRVNGLDVYVYSEPIMEYEVIDKVTAFWNWNADKEGRSTIDDVVKTMIKRASKKNKHNDKKGEEEADGIIIDDNYNGIMIRYKKRN